MSSIGARSTAARAVVAAAATVAATIVVSVAAAAGADVQREPVRWHMQSGNPHLSLVGEGTTGQLVRRESGISYSMQTSGLRPGHAYTVWVVIINNPAACAASPCSPADILLNAATQSTVVYGTGHVVGESGMAGFGGSLRTGDLPSGWIAGGGLRNPLGAHVHLVLNDHGPVLTEYMPEMIQTYRAGCTDASLPGIFPASAKADGTPGPNECRLWQAVIFE